VSELVRDTEGVKVHTLHPLAELFERPPARQCLQQSCQLVPDGGVMPSGPLGRVTVLEGRTSPRPGVPICSTRRTRYLDWDGSTKHPAGLRLADVKSFRLMAPAAQSSASFRRSRPDITAPPLDRSGLGSTRAARAARRGISRLQHALDAASCVPPKSQRISAAASVPGSYRYADLR
jgi:hypothetical protein